MSDTGRKDFHTQIKEKLKPDFQKSPAEKEHEHVTNQADRMAAHAEPNSQKGFLQKTVDAMKSSNPTERELAATGGTAAGRTNIEGTVPGTTAGTGMGTTTGHTRHGLAANAGTTGTGTGIGTTHKHQAASTGTAGMGHTAAQTGDATDPVETSHYVRHIGTTGYADPAAHRSGQTGTEHAPSQVPPSHYQVR